MGKSSRMDWSTLLSVSSKAVVELCRRWESLINALSACLESGHQRYRAWTVGQTLHWYIVRELLRPTLIAFGGLTVLLLAAELFGFSDLIINRGFGLGAILRLIGFKLLALASTTLSFACLVGLLVGLGRLKTDLETLALHASGVSQGQCLGPVLTFCAAVTALGLLLTLSVSPWARRGLDSLQTRVAQDNPAGLLRAGETQTLGNTRILAREVSSGGDRLGGVLLWTPHGSGTSVLDGQTIFAQHGEVRSNGNGEAHLTLHKGVSLSPIRGSGNSTRFDTLWTSLHYTPPSPVAAGDERRTEHLAFQDVALRGWPPDSQPGDEYSVRLAQTEFHRRLATPVASLVFGLLATPLVLLGRTFSRAAGGLCGLLIAAVYYGLIQLGNGLIQAGLPPPVGVWLPNMLVGGIAFVLVSVHNGWPHWSHPIGHPASQLLHPPALGGLKDHILPRYVVRSYGSMLLVSFGFLFTGYVLVDMLERLQWFARHQAGFGEIVRFYCARSPLLASRMVPMSLLLATALTVGVLSVNREVIGMRACGVSVLHALSPILLIAGLVAPAYLVLNEAIVPRTNAWADWLKITEIKSAANQTRLQPLALWHQHGKLYHTRQLDTVNRQARDISIYELDDSGLPTSRTDARSARHIGDGVWVLTDPIRLAIRDDSFEVLPAPPHIQLGTEPHTQVDTMHLNARQLSRTIRHTEADGYDATAYRVAWHMKLAAPLACVFLPAVALFFALSGPPFPGPALTILVSCGLGIGSILLSDMFASLGYGAHVPPGLAGWGPYSVLFLVAAAFAVRSQSFETVPDAIHCHALRGHTLRATLRPCLKVLRETWLTWTRLAAAAWLKRRRATGPN